LFGIIDIVAINRSHTLIYGIQVTSDAHHAERRNKILASKEARAWVEAGGALMVLSFGKKGARGKAKHWEAREEMIGLAEFNASARTEAAGGPTINPEAENASGHVEGTLAGFLADSLTAEDLENIT
jgi:hypothetical protein